MPSSMTPLWSDHPLFDAVTRQDAAERLNLFDDGLVFVGADMSVTSANVEACAIMGCEFGAVDGEPFAALCAELPGWAQLAEAVDRGANAELTVRTAKGKTLLVTVRRATPGPKRRDPGARRPVVVILRDLEVLDYRRRKAFGHSGQPTFRTLADNKARPDFGTQRRIAPQLEKVLSRGERAALQGARVLITGESGVGKTEIARYFHTFLADTGDAFQVVNCASIHETLFESEMFGYEKGAFTGALQSGRAGFIEQAEGGTLFLDEVGEIPLSVQAKLLSFLEEGVIRRVGGGRQRVANVRILAATNRDLRQMVREGQFRADLYYRLAVVHLPIPALRTMPELIGHLIDRFVDTINQRRGDRFVVPDWVRARLTAYAWPGNVRELLNVVQQLSIFFDEGADMDELLSDLLRPLSAPPSSSEVSPGGGDEALPALAETVADIAPDGAFDLKEQVRRYERTLIEKAIKQHGSKRKAARALGVDIGTVVRKTSDISMN